MTPRFRLTIIHSVPDYERWAAAMRKNRRQVDGAVAMTVCRSIDDPDEVMVNIELESADLAKELVSSTNFRDFLDRAGVEIYPPVFVGEVVDDLSSPRANGQTGVSGE
jgi:heme-degrading monooxygenase HmoA